MTSQITLSQVHTLLDSAWDAHLRYTPPCLADNLCNRWWHAATSTELQSLQHCAHRRYGLERTSLFCCSRFHKWLRFGSIMRRDSKISGQAEYPSLQRQTPRCWGWCRCHRLLRHVALLAAGVCSCDRQQRARHFSSHRIPMHLEVRYMPTQQSGRKLLAHPPHRLCGGALTLRYVHTYKYHPRESHRPLSFTSPYTS